MQSKGAKTEAVTVTQTTMEGGYLEIKQIMFRLKMSGPLNPMFHLIYRNGRGPFVLN